MVFPALFFETHNIATNMWHTDLTIHTAKTFPQIDTYRNIHRQALQGNSGMLIFNFLIIAKLPFKVHSMNCV